MFLSHFPGFFFCTAFATFSFDIFFLFSTLFEFSFMLVFHSRFRQQFGVPINAVIDFTNLELALMGKVAECVCFCCKV